MPTFACPLESNITDLVKARMASDLAMFLNDKDLPAVSLVSAVMMKAYPCQPTPAERAQVDPQTEAISDLVDKAGEYITTNRRLPMQRARFKKRLVPASTTLR